MRGLLSDAGITINPAIDLSDTSILLLGTGVGEGRQAGLIPYWSLRFERATGRTFGFSKEVTVTVDGSGRPELLLPPEYVSRDAAIVSVVAGASPIPLGDLDLSELQHGVVKIKSGQVTERTLIGGFLGGSWSQHDWRSFPKGYGNIRVTLSYGYADGGGDNFEPPDDVSQAVARKCAIDVLTLESATDDRGGGVQNIRIDYWSESYPSDGRWAHVVKRWEADWVETVSSYSLKSG